MKGLEVAQVKEKRGLLPSRCLPPLWSESRGFSPKSFICLCVDTGTHWDTSKALELILPGRGLDKVLPEDSAFPSQSPTFAFSGSTEVVAI